MPAYTKKTIIVFTEPLNNYYVPPEWKQYINNTVDTLKTEGFTDGILYGDRTDNIGERLWTSQETAQSWIDFALANDNANKIVSTSIVDYDPSQEPPP